MCHAIILRPQCLSTVRHVFPRVGDSLLNRNAAQYAAAAHVPLIKSPSLRVPRPVELPPDIHPLPDSISPYFVYPFTLEPHILTMESARRNTLAAHAARRDAYLQSREEEKTQRQREALRRIAPGFEPQGAPLVPMKRDSANLGQGQGLWQAGSPMGSLEGGADTSRPRSAIEDLVDQLEALDAASSSRRS